MQPSRFAKRLIVPAFLVAGLIVAGVVLAAPPIPSFTITPPAGNECGVWTFTSTSTDADNDIQTIDWNLGGTAVTGTPVQATFGTPGARIITMSATDGAEGDADLGAETVPALPQTANVQNGGAPSAVVTAPTTGQLNEVITFNGATSADAGSGSIVKYEWDKDGNGSYETDTGTVATTTAAFATGGQHTVRLRVTDNCGAQTADATSVFVSNSLPTASFTVAPNPAAIGAAVTFNGSASADAGTGTIAKYEWDLDGNGTFETDTGTTSSAARTYTAARSYAVQLRVTDNDGGSDTAFQTLRVNAPPSADFAFTPAPVLVGDAVTFRLTRADDADGTIARYDWDLNGDGVYERTGATPTAEKYSTAGARTVRLRVTDDDGAQTVIPKRLDVGSNQRPNAIFQFTPRAPYAGDEVTFTSTSDDPDDRLTKQEWDLDGDGRYEAQGRVASRKFKRGRHKVSLRVTDSRGASEVKTTTLTVRAEPLAEAPDVRSSIGYSRRSWGSVIVALIVKVPAKTTVSVACKGQGCPKGTFKRRTRAKAGTLRFNQLHGSIRAGARITIVSRRKGHVTAHDTYLIRAGSKAPLLREQCVWGSKKKPRACP